MYLRSGDGTRLALAISSSTVSSRISLSRFARTRLTEMNDTPTRTSTHTVPSAILTKPASSAPSQLAAPCPMTPFRTVLMLAKSESNHTTKYPDQRVVSRGGLMKKSCS